MQNFKSLDEHKRKFSWFVLPFIANVICLSYSLESKSQDCPPNMDFETGTFDHWNCFAGFTTNSSDTINLIILFPTGSPLNNHHTMYTSNNKDLDYYGGFPVVCPNGSGHSIKLGSTKAGGEAEGVSYEFAIPPDKNSYSITYHYAVVFQSPFHKIAEQPRVEIIATDATTNKVINCGSLSFIAGPSLPGFSVSPKSDSTIVYYKGWTAVTIDLSGNAGKTINLFFKTADCTFSEHFAYAYFDVDSECSGGLIGATYCADDTVVHITGPYGYRDYTWYDSSLTKVLGQQQTVALAPIPPPGSTIAVKVNPFDGGYGCAKTIFTSLQPSLVVNANGGRDTLSCNHDPVPIGTIPKLNFSYQWSPVAGLSNSGIANPFAAPDSTTAYIVTTRSSGGGCPAKDTVVVRSSEIDSSLTVIGKAAFCIGEGDSAVLKIHTAKNIQWFKDDAPLNNFKDTIYRAVTSGTYYALLGNAAGCIIISQRKIIAIDTPKSGITYPTQYAIFNLPLALEARKIGQTALWRPRVNLNNPESFSPTFKGISEQLYTIEIRTIAGCVTVDTQLVKAIKGVEIFVPNAFTPNNDGTNDYLRPILRGVKEISYFRIFNREGNLLFESNLDKPGWDGVFKGMPQTTQAVVWILKCIGLDGLEYTKKGSSVLLR